MRVFENVLGARERLTEAEWETLHRTARMGIECARREGAPEDGFTTRDAEERPEEVEAAVLRGLQDHALANLVAQLDGMETWDRLPRGHAENFADMLLLGLYARQYQQTVTQAEINDATAWVRWLRGVPGTVDEHRARIGREVATHHATAELAHLWRGMPASTPTLRFSVDRG